MQKIYSVSAVSSNNYVAFIAIFIALILPAAPSQAAKEGGPDWSYENHGSFAWADKYATCDGDQQSPININLDKVDNVYDAEGIEFGRYSQSIDAHVRNSGKTFSVVLQGNASDWPTMKRGGLGGEYVAAGLHFHWGSEDQIGSEHTINGDQYPLEMHIVHFNKGYGNTLIQAIAASGLNKTNESSVLAVLGIFFETVKTDEAADAEAVTAIANLFANAGNDSIETTVDLRSMLPSADDVFYRYMGSLTTPPCSEIVTWTILKETVKIDQETMDMFRNLPRKDGDVSNVEGKLVDNFRPIRLRNGRAVSQFHAADSASSASSSSRLILSSSLSSALFLSKFDTFHQFVGWRGVLALPLVALSTLQL